MPQIPVNTPLGYIGIVMLVVGMFLLLTGFNILKVEKVTVKPGKPTWGVGFAFSILGILLLMVSEPITSGKNPDPNPTPFPSPAPIIVTTTPLVTETIPTNPTITPDSDSHKKLLDATTWPLVIQETFDSNDAGWELTNGEWESSKQSTEIKDGKLNWFVKQKSNNWYWHISPFYSYSDFYLSVKGRSLAGTNIYAWYGLVFRKQGNKCYIFRIDDEQSFAIHYWDNNKWTELIGWTKIAQVNPNKFNELSVIADGPNMDFFVNNAHVGSIVDNSLSSGNIGLAISLDDGSEAAFEFDDLILRERP